MSKTITRIFPSEFSKGGYNRSFIEKCIDAAMRIPDNEATERRIAELFNQYLLSDRLETHSWNRKAYLTSDGYRKMLEQLDIPALDMLNDAGDNYEEYTIDFEEELRKLKAALEKLPEDTLFDMNDSYDYLDEFLHISAKAVFNPDNNNLNNLVFRKSRTLDALYSIGRMPFVRGKAGKGEDEGYSFFNICNPFALDSLRRLIENLAERGRFSRVPLLRPLRVSILQDQAQRAFTRFTSYSTFSTYKVELNRHSSEILSVPYHRLSSIEAVKPLRLFEKTVTYIHKRLMDLGNLIFDKELKINVLFIGHTEESVDEKKEFDERELYDWICAVLAWYDRSFDKKAYPTLKLKVTQLLNDGDFCPSLESKDHQREKLSGSYRSQKYEWEIQTVDYQSEFYFSTAKLKKYCQDNDLTYIIDCPWLTVESYELKKDISMGMYARRLNRLKTFSAYSADRLDSERQTVMQELDTQYNRITSSDSSMHGDISRVFRDKVLTDIKSFIDNNNNRKERQELYVFTSERDGVDYSLLGSHPLTRTELYGGKCFTISMFSNVTPSRLQVGEVPEPFIVKLWSVLKYISVSYACTAFRDSVAEIIGSYIQSPEQYFELMRDIFVIIEPSRNLKEITVSVRFSERIAVLFDEIGLDAADSERIKKELYGLAYNFIYALYTQAVFSDNDDFGDNFIKTGFEMNLTSTARNVNDMLFIYEYHKAVANRETDRYTVNWKKRYNPAYCEDKNYVHEFFMDKELFSILLHNLEYNDSLSIGALAMLNRSNRIYHTPAMAHRLMKNIVSAYEAAQLDYYRIVQNVKNAIRQLK